MRQVKHREVSDLSEVLGENSRASAITAGPGLLEDALPKGTQRFESSTAFISQADIHRSHYGAGSPLTTIHYRTENCTLKSNCVAKTASTCILKRKMYHYQVPNANQNSLQPKLLLSHATLHVFTALTIKQVKQEVSSLT